MLPRLFKELLFQHAAQPWRLNALDRFRLRGAQALLMQPLPYAALQGPVGGIDTALHRCLQELLHDTGAHTRPADQQVGGHGGSELWHGDLA